MMMDLLTRYLGRQYISFFVLILCLLTTLYLGIDYMSKIGEYKMPLLRVAQLYFYKLPSIVQQFVPVGCLMATLIILSTMSKQNEVLALYSSGISPSRISQIFISLTALFCTVSFLAFDFLVPQFSVKEWLLSRGLDTNNENISLLNPNGLWYRSGTKIYYFGQIDPNEHTLQDVRIYYLDPNYQIQKKIHASQAFFKDNSWHLLKGQTIFYQGDSPYPKSEPFNEIEGVISETPQDFKGFYSLESAMRLKDLRKAIEKNTAYGLDTTSYKIKYYERLALVFVPLIFVLLVIPISIQPLRNRSMARGVALSILIVFTYLIFFKITLSLAKNGQLSSFVGAWMPNFFFLSLATVLYVKKL